MPIPDGRVRDRRQREQLIVTTARELAEAEGWGAVTTRRLADAIHYSQPVRCSHFPGKGALIQAVAIDGSAQLSQALRDARQAARRPHSALLALVNTYLDFASVRPALYDAMFTLADLPFAQAETPSELNDAFAQLSKALDPFSSPEALATDAEVFWSALHGLALLSRSGRLRPGFAEQRLATVMRSATTRVGGGP